jgi:GNAT superfamily N-acetyltransferase
MWRQVLRHLIGEYTVFRIFQAPVLLNHIACANGIVCRPIVDLHALETSANCDFRKLTGFARLGAECFGAYDGDQVAAVCGVWSGEASNSNRGYMAMSLRDSELVHVYTSPAFRGRGIASDLIRFATYAVRSKGTKRVFARVWHSNRASVRAFEKAGWSQIYFAIQLSPPLWRRPVQIRIRWGQRLVSNARGGDSLSVH